MDPPIRSVSMKDPIYGNLCNASENNHQYGRSPCRILWMECIWKFYNVFENNCFEMYIITYLVSCRRSIEIWRVCKIYGRRGGAEPSIYFTNPPYFYRPSATDQISVLFRRGP